MVKQRQENNTPSCSGDKHEEETEYRAVQGSFAKAAVELNVTPGAISHQIRGMQDFFGVTLLAWHHWEWEYISNEWIDTQLADEPGKPFQSREGFPFSILEQAQIFEDLVDCATRHFENTGRYLQIWGEFGEIYAEIKFGLRRHGTHTAGSDGTISGKLVEVKTISPEKAGNHVLVKSQGAFEQLLIVRIDRDFQFQGKLFDRSELKGITGKFLKGHHQG